MFRKTLSLLLSIAMLMTMVPIPVQAAGNGFTAVSITDEIVTPETSTLTVNITNLPSSGIFCIVMMDNSETFDSDKLNNYTSLYFAVLSNLQEGNNTLTLATAPMAGKKLVAVVRDTTATMTDYPSEPIVVSETPSIISIATQEITAETTELTLNFIRVPAYGMVKVIELSENEVYDESKLNSYNAIYTAYFYSANLNVGENNVLLTNSPTPGKVIYAVARDSEVSPTRDYISAGIIVAGEEPPKKTYEQILANCSVQILDNGAVRTESFKQENTTVGYSAVLDNDVLSCHLQFFAYPGNAAFDPDSNIVKRLGGCDITGTDAKGTMAIDLTDVPVGYRVVAALYVKLADDFYRTWPSNPRLEVVDANGLGFQDYVYPVGSIVETAISSDMTSLHISLTGDERIFAAAKAGTVSIKVAVGQYPADANFDFEGEHQISLVSNLDATEPFVNKEVQLIQALKPGYRVRAVVYWSQNTDLILTKGNEYESVFNRPDDSVIVTQAEETDFIISFSNSIYTNDANLTFHVAAKEGMENTILNIVGLCKVDNNGNTDITNSNSYVVRAFGKTAGDITLENISGLVAGDNLRFVIRYFDATNEMRTVESKTFTVLAPTTPAEATVAITSEALTVDSTDISISAQFDNTALLTIYTYSDESFDPAKLTQDERSNYAAIKFLANSPASTTVNFTDNTMLREGDKLIAVLWTNLSGDMLAKSEPITIAAAAPKSQPVAYIRNSDKLTAGQTSVVLTTGYDSRCSDVTYTLYQFDGDALDKSTATVVISGRPSNNTYDTYYVSPGRLTAGSKLQLSVVADGVEALSNVVTVLPAPDWGTPYAAFNVSAVKSDDKSVSIKVDYSDEYLKMDGFYCDVTLYTFSAAYTDQEFAENELWEQFSVVKSVGKLNSTYNEQTRGELTIPLYESATLTPGDRLIIKVRLPHTEWEGEEVDYISSSVPILSNSEIVKGPVVLLYNLEENKSLGSRLREVLAELGVSAVDVTNDQLSQTVGYLAGMEGYEYNTDPYNGQGNDVEFMLMANFPEALLDRFLAAMTENGISIGHKAVTTAYNVEYQFHELIDDIANEHQVFQALLELDKLLDKAEALTEEQYGGLQQWDLLQTAIAEGNKVLSSYEPSLESLLTAIENLKEPYLVLTGLVEISGTAIITTEVQSDGTYKLTVSVQDGGLSDYVYTWSSGEIGNVLSGVSPDDLITKKVTITSSSALGALTAQLAVPDVPGMTVNVTGNAISVSFTESDEVLNAPAPTEYIADLYLDGALVKTASVSSGEKISFTGLKNNTGYVLKGYAVNIVGRSNIVEKSVVTGTSVGNRLTGGFGDHQHISTPEIGFVDIPAGIYYEDAVQWAIKNNITNGTSETTFSPNAVCTREQAVAFLWGAAGRPMPTVTDCMFEDISPNEWSYYAILWAAENGITMGTSATEFSPDSICTRSQIITFIARFTGVTDESTEVVFDDVSRSAYYAAAVTWAVNYGVTNGTSATTFSPDADCSRAQIMTFLYRYMVK